MKKIINVFFCLLFILQINYTFATTTLDANLKIDKSVIDANEIINLSIGINNIQETEEGINAFIGTLNFDSTKFELVEIEGMNGWNNPAYNLENSKTGITKIAMTKNSFSKKNGDIAKIVLKAKKDINDYSEIGITNMSAATKVNEKTEKILLNDQIVKINDEKLENNIVTEENKKNNNINKNFAIWIVIVILILIVIISTIIGFYKFKRRK